MKNIIKYISFFVVAGLFIFCFNSCEEENNYDYSKIVPRIVGGVSGPTEVLATGVKAETFKVVNRGGSTWTWQVVGSDAVIEQDENFGSIAKITFAASAVDKSAMVIVSETTQGGLSASDTLDISLLKFEKLTWDDFAGTWTGTEPDDTEASFEIVKGSTENSLIIQAAAGIPGIFGGIYIGWGEAFQAGFGNEGNVMVDVDLNTGDLTIAPQYFGQTLPGPWDYFIYGSGYYNGYTLTLTYSLNFDDTYSDDYEVYTTVFSKSAK